MIIRLRSALFTPGTHTERFSKAGEIGADALIIDLEDAVAPADKVGARRNALRALASPATSMVRILRINGLDTRQGLEDILALLDSGTHPDYVLLPKTESSTHLFLLDRLLGQAGSSVKLIGLIESARGVRNLSEIATSTPRLEALMLGAADLAADYGCGPEAPNLTAARAQLVQACVIAGIAAIDSPYFDLEDSTGMLAAAMQAADMGFAGKAAVHPSQVKAINDAFTPTAEAVAHARAVLAENRAGVGKVDGQMVDEAVARKARRVLAAIGETTTRI